MHNLIIGSVLLAFIFGFIFALGVGVKKTEIAECEVWQLEAVRYPGYFLAGWQKNQCDHYGIQINAPAIEK